jgi:hypothetical protein
MLKQAVKDFARGLDMMMNCQQTQLFVPPRNKLKIFVLPGLGCLKEEPHQSRLPNFAIAHVTHLKTILMILATILNDGIPAYIENNLPPLLSDPGCDNGLAPFEPEAIAKATTNALDGNMEALKIAYTYDMIGNGPGERNWGFMNMVLSDTMGNPYTAHVRKSFNSGGWLFKRKYVDFNATKVMAAGIMIHLQPSQKQKTSKGRFPTRLQTG